MWTPKILSLSGLPAFLSSLPVAVSFAFASFAFASFPFFSLPPTFGKILSEWGI